MGIFSGKTCQWFSFRESHTQSTVRGGMAALNRSLQLQKEGGVASSLRSMAQRSVCREHERPRLGLREERVRLEEASSSCSVRKQEAWHSPLGRAPVA